MYVDRSTCWEFLEIAANNNFKVFFSKELIILDNININLHNFMSMFTLYCTEFSKWTSTSGTEFLWNDLEYNTEGHFDNANF